MTQLYPLLLKPIFSRRPWGARDLAPIYDVHAHPGEEPIGEAWLTGDACPVANGPLAGRKLGELVAQFGRELVGEAPPRGDHFPLLIKFLFPRDKLSVQVHPDDEGARRLNQPCGKTECWYVLDAEPGATIALGLKPGATCQEFECAIRETRAEELLNVIPISPGELYYVDAGTVHAIGPGSILVETQQNSDTTYRLYDYGRPRELHIRDGLLAMKECTCAGRIMPELCCDGERLISVSSFAVDKLVLSEPQDFRHDGASVQCLTVIGGCAVIEAAGMEPAAFARGDCIVIPATAQRFRIRPQWSVELLRANVPGVPNLSPETEIDNQRLAT